MRLIRVLLTTALCIASPTVKADEPKYDFQAGRRGETVEVRVDGKQTVFAITGKGPVGAVTIRLKEGDWPQNIVLRLNGFDNVESFTATSDRVTFGGEQGLSNGGVLALSRKLPFRFANAKGEFEKGKNAGTLDVIIEKSKDALDFKLPANVFTGSREVKLAWVIFVR
jgi:hypothetical protein